MAGLLDYENETNPLNMMLVLGGLGMMGAQNTAQGFGQGAAQGLLNYQQGQDKRRELEMLREKMRMQAAQEERQNRLTDAQISHYQALNNKAAQGPDPYYQVMETSNGLYRFNARTGEYEPLLANDKPLMRSTSDPVRQGEIAGQKSGNTYADFETPEGQKFRGKNGDFGLTVDALLPGLINAESGGNPNAVSPKGAFGLTQIMPETAKNPGYGVQPMQNNTPEEQVRFGRDYLQAMIDANGGDVQKGLSAYNQGQGNLQRNGITNQGYVNKVLGFGPSLKQKEDAQTQGALERKQNDASIDISKDQTAQNIQKTKDATGVLSILEEADPLIEKATGSQGGVLLDNTMGFFGKSNEGANAAAKLKTIQANLLKYMPKMSGPQSDRDVELYKQMAGAIGDPMIPAEQKRAAYDTVKQINEKYLNQQDNGIDSLLNKYGIR